MGTDPPIEGLKFESPEWLLVDAGSTVVHIFTEVSDRLFNPWAAAAAAQPAQRARAGVRDRENGCAEARGPPPRAASKEGVQPGGAVGKERGGDEELHARQRERQGGGG